uniref:Uncharacterized protein n=1 Tax=Cacopsylla melanoneura TaxID=428564 RepID=A0A8D8R578_9HEMI
MKGLIMFWTAIALVLMLSNGGCAYSALLDKLSNPTGIPMQVWKSSMSWVAGIKPPVRYVIYLPLPSAQNTNRQLPTGQSMFLTNKPRRLAKTNPRKKVHNEK